MLREEIQHESPTRRRVDAAANAVGACTVALEAAMFQLDPRLRRTFGDESHFDFAGMRRVGVVLPAFIVLAGFKLNTVEVARASQGAAVVPQAIASWSWTRQVKFAGRF